MEGLREFSQKIPQTLPHINMKPLVSLNDVYRQLKRFRDNHKRSKVENLVIHVRTNHV